MGKNRSAGDFNKREMVRLLIPLMMVMQLLTGLRVGAQTRSAIFDHLSVEDGLSQSEVLCIYKDRNGFMWFGTGDGLNRYDGYNFSYYKNQPFDPASLSHNRVLSLYEDAAGTMWVGTLNGLNRIDPVTRTITRIKEVIPEDKNVLLCAINQIYEDRWGTLWLATNAGLLRVITEVSAQGEVRYQVVRYLHEPERPRSLNSNHVSAILVDKSGRIWVGTLEGLNLLQIDDRQLPPARQQVFFQHAGNDSSNIFHSSRGRVSAMEEDQGGNLWVGTYDNGLFRIDPFAREVAHFTYQPRTAGSLSSNEVSSILCDQRGSLWVGTSQHGLNISRAPAHAGPVSFDNFQDDLHEIKALRSSGINTLYEARGRNEDLVWIGTRGSGLSKYSRTKNSFTIWSNLMNKVQNHASLSTFAITTDHHQNLWVGTLNGLFRIGPDQKITHFTHQAGNPRSLSNNMVLHLFTDRQGTVWVGTRFGLNRFEPDRNGFRRYVFKDQKHHRPENEILKMYQDREGALWLGTGLDLKKFDPLSGATVSYVHNPADEGSLRTYFVTSILEDTAGVLWVGTHFGLNKLDRKKGSFTHFQHDPSLPKSLISDAVLSLLLDRKGQLWVSTDKGLSRVRHEEKRISFENYTEQSGLPNGFVYGALEDRQGNLWLSTNLGISRFDPYNKSFKNYDVGDGLPHNEFNMGAFHESPGGELFFGGNMGVVSFYPERLERNRNVPTIRITRFSKMQKPVPLDSLLQAEGEVVLTHKDNFFSFEFVALDFTNTQKNQYAYKLEGFNDDWVETGSRRYASFSNLSPGEYTFRVKGSNSDGIWNVDPEATVRLVINPPFWRTFWFYGLAILVFGAVTMLYNNYRIRKRVKRLLELEKVTLAENERVRKLAAEDLHDEFGNRLTRISLLTELIKVKLNGHSGEVAPLLQKISENSNQLYHGTKDFIWSINPENDSFYEVAVRLKDFGDELFYNTSIQFQSTGLSEDLKSVRLPMGTSRHLILLFKEAMNNIVKYAECRQVQLQFQKKALLWTIKLIDDGKGFDRKADRNGNGLGNMESRARKVNGKVIITSAPGKGTTIEFLAAIPHSGGYIVNP